MESRLVVRLEVCTPPNSHARVVVAKQTQTHTQQDPIPPFIDPRTGGGAHTTLVATHYGCYRGTGRLRLAAVVEPGHRRRSCGSDRRSTRHHRPSHGIQIYRNDFELYQISSDMVGLIMKIL